MRTAHDYRETLANWHTAAPANDNSPMDAASFTDLAARRAFVQRTQGNPAPVLNLPQLERLGRSAPDAVRLWKFWRDLQCAPAADVFAEPEIITEEGDEPANTGFSTAEQDLEIRPSVDELQRAWESAPARRVSVHCVVRNGERTNVMPVIEPIVEYTNGAARIGPLVFHNGRLTRWGYTARGVPLKPVEQLRAEKGSREQPTPRDVRHLVRTDAPVARNAAFLAGAVHPTGRSGAPLECFAEREQTREAEQGLLRQALGSHGEILDMAIGDSTAREIGEQRGYQGKHAERRGIFLINEAFAALRTLVGENLLPKAA
jgi:hypothetical protein